MTERVAFGIEYQDSITGFVGTATARTEYIGGNVSVRLERADSTGKPEEVWLPEHRLESRQTSMSKVGIR